MPEDTQNTPDTPEQSTEDIQALITKAVADATSGLEKSRDTVLSEKKALQQKSEELSTTLEQLGGKDGVARLLQMKTQLEESELGGLLSDGKYDEWFDQRTEAMRSGFTNQIESLSGKATEAEERAKAAEGRHRDLLLEISVREACTRSEGFVDTAVVDALTRARGFFDYDTELDRPVIRDQAGGILPGKDGVTPKTVVEWLDEQKKDARHWWGESRGAGAVGGRGPESAGDIIESMRNAKTQAEYAELRRQQEGKEKPKGFAGHRY